MKKMILGFLCLLLLTSCDSSCKLDGKNVCVDKDQNFLIEAEAEIKIAVETTAYGEAISELWNQKYPESKDAIEYVLYSDFDYNEYNNQYTDVALLWDSYAIRMQDLFMDIDPSNNGLKRFLADNFIINKNHFNYIPQSGFGSVFSYNETLLNNLWYEVVDDNNDNLPDAFDSFEEIFAINNNLDNDSSLKIMPINFDDYFTSFVYTTLGFDIFNTDKAEDPCFDTESFLNSLNGIYELGSLTDESGFDYESYLHDQSSLFSIVGTWMFYEEEEDLNQVNFRYAAFPMFKEMSFKPLAHSKGYMISKDTLYPSACNALLDLIRSEDGLNAYLANTSEILLFNHDAQYNENEETYNLIYQSENKYEISKALLNSQIEDYAAFEDFNTVQGFKIVEDIDLIGTFEKVFKHELSPEEAYDLINSESLKWISNYIIEEEK